MQEITTIITILHYKHARITIDCLKSIKASAATSYHIVLVLNGCSMEDRISLHNLFDDWELLTILEEAENTGFAEGHNIAIRHSFKHFDTDYILILNNDVIVEPDFLERAVAKAREGFDMVQLLQKDFDNPKRIDSAGIKLTRSGLTFNITALADPAPLFCPSAGAALYSTELLKNCTFERTVMDGFTNKIIRDYFDSAYFLYAEDFDLGFRAALKGYKAALAHQAIVYHRGSASTSTMSDVAVYHTYRNLLWTYLKCYPGLWLMLYTPCIVLGQLAIFAKSYTRKQHKAILNAWKDAWQGREAMLQKRKLIQSSVKIKNTSLNKLIAKSLW